MRRSLLLMLLCGLVVGWLGGACLPKVPASSATGASLALVAVGDSVGEPGAVAVSSVAADALAKPLQARGFQVALVGLDASVARVANTEARVRALQGRPEGVVMLVELEPRYFGLVGGRYRWTVKVTSTVFAGEERLQTTSTEVPVFLLYTNQGAPDAVDASVPLVQRHLALALEQWLASSP